MQRAMAKQAEAEREKRSKVIHADGEAPGGRSACWTRLRACWLQEPAALQLRYLQTLSEIATEHSTSIVFPIPIDILRPFYELAPARNRSRGLGSD